MKIQTKTTLLFAALTIAFFISIDITVYYFVEKAAYNDFHKRLELRAKISAKFRFEHNDPSTASFKQLQKEYLEKLSDEAAFIFSVDDTTNKIYPDPPPEISKTFLQSIMNANGETMYDQRKFRHYAGILYTDSDKKKHIVIKSAVNRLGMELLHKLRDVMIITLICGALLSYLLGYIFTRRTFSPFRTITDRVKKINENNLHLRLEERGGSDEISELTQTFNRMIDRIEVAFESQKNFISNASHELRTPLTTIIGEADFALNRQHSVEEYKESLNTISNQASKLHTLIKGLLDLAQTGFDGKKLTWEKVRLDELIFNVKSNADAIIPDNNVVVHIEQMPDDEKKLHIRGNADMLKIAISNIVLNACKYSDNKPVDFTLRFYDNDVTITIKDYGIGIPQEELKYIYDPFFRASNTNKYEGYGIGMPLSFNIVRLHNGKILVDSRQNEGTTVIITLPICYKKD